MTPERPSRLARWRARLLWWAGVGLAILIWYWAALGRPEYALPGPETTWRALLGLIDDGGLGWTLWLTLSRAIIGLGLSCVIGIPTGWALGTWTWLRELLDSWVQVLMAVPPIVLVVVGMIWLGPTAGVVILVVTLVTLPLLVASMRDAVLNVDSDLLEMATVFSKPGPWTIRRIILPAVAPPVLSALTVAVGQSVRVTVMAELLSTPTGLGAEVQQARTNLETADVFALSVIMAALTLLLELCLLRPLRRRLMAWSPQHS
ncbi:ABC transporter permease [Actinomyces oris]|uniref:ABC transporter permease n=1 Tax=Actinomyces oris TaxID=544580 RepID=A0A1Q8I318_9ACTO|nr:ABC transporter permease subunit [Actinomyces oris]OLL15498.1 ABC transporter permease [Actinomyces oris]OLO53053.1 ABC transporter permease [Actinomyces oris]